MRHGSFNQIKIRVSSNWEVRKKLVAIEDSDEPFIKKLKPLLKKDFFIIQALIKF